MFGAKKMRVFAVHSTPTCCIGEGISNWKLLLYLIFDNNDGFKDIPQSIDDVP